MPILTEIIDWVQDKPFFWQVAVDRLIRNNSLTKADLSDLTSILRSEQGIGTHHEVPVDFKSLKAFAQQTASGQSLVLSKIHSTQNIKALSPAETLAFAPAGLTVIYGDNGSGKSSYISILKHVCHTRGDTSPLKSNLFDPIAKDKLATVEYAPDGAHFASVTLHNDTISDMALKKVDVFDSGSANHYIEGEDEIAFIPIGLALLDKLASALKQIETQFQREIQQLSQRRFDHLSIDIPTGTTAQKYLSTVNAKTSLDELRKSFPWKQEDVSRMAVLNNDIAVLKALDPKKAIQAKQEQIRRLQSLLQRFNGIEAVLFAAPDQFLSTLNQYVAASETLTITSKNTFSELPIDGIGNASWKILWESARTFYNQSQQREIFPEIGETGNCPLCLQHIAPDVQDRLNQFELFVKNDVQVTYDEAQAKYQALRKKINQVSLDFQEQEPTMQELETAYPGYLPDQQKYLDYLSTAKAALLRMLDDKKSVQQIAPITTDFIAVAFLQGKLSELEQDIQTLQNTSIDTELLPLQKEWNELTGIKGIHIHKPKIGKEIVRQKKEALLNQCIAQCNTRAVTLFSNALTPVYVTQHLKLSFQEELQKLGFRNIKIEAETKGARGKQYHYLRLDEDNATNISLKDVLSEGEHRCISLATFLAELSISDHKNAIVFDDPVSSLDHKWRNKIAKRLAEEAQLRQVIVFTHDITFLLMLQEHCAATQTSIDIKSLTRKQTATGIIGVNPPWDALPVSKRAGILKNKLQQLVKEEKTDTEEVFKEKVKQFYGKLREAWERFVEEVLLNGVVKRFGREIHTMQLKKIIDITDSDISTVSENMKKCSIYFDGHDTGDELIESYPDTHEIQQDITQLEQFITDVRKRRDK